MRCSLPSPVFCFWSPFHGVKICHNSFAAWFASGRSVTSIGLGAGRVELTHLHFLPDQPKLCHASCRKIRKSQPRRYCPSQFLRRWCWQRFLSEFLWFVALRKVTAIWDTSGESSQVCVRDPGSARCRWLVLTWALKRGHRLPGCTLLLE